MIEGFQVSVTSALQVVPFVMQAYLHFVLRVRKQAIAVVDHMQRYIRDFKSFELFLANE